MMAAVLCVMLLTACGNDSKQSGNANAQSQSESRSTVQGSEPENQDNEVITGTEAQSETEDIADSGQNVSDHTDGQTGKVLVVYYSASGNTKAVAETIAQYTNGDTFEIVPVEEYTSEDLNWTQDGSRVNREHEDESLQDIALVSTTVEDFDSYDTVFIGYPKMEYGFDWVLCV